MAKPDRVEDVYTTGFLTKGAPSDKEGADEVILSAWGGPSAHGASAIFKLPRHADLFDQVKGMLVASYHRGRDALGSELRDLLGVKECSHDDDR